MLRVRQPFGLGVQPVGGKAHVVGHDVAPQPIGKTVDGAVHLLAVQAHVQPQRLGGAARAGVARFKQRALLPGRMRGHAAHGGQAVRLRGAGVPHVIVALLLQRQAQLLAGVNAIAVLPDQRARVIARARHLAIGRAHIALIAQRRAQHQRMIAPAGIHHRHAVGAPAGTFKPQARAPLHAGHKARLRQPHVDGPTQGARAIQHRGRPLDHLHLLGQPQRGKRSHRPHGLRGIEPHAIHHQHHAVALQAANHRIDPLRAVARCGQARLAPQRLAHIGRLFARQILLREHRGGHRRVGRDGLIPFGGDRHRWQCDDRLFLHHGGRGIGRFF